MGNHINLRDYFAAQALCALNTALVALALDALLREFGIAIHPWKEAVAAGLGGLIFASLLVPVLWHLKLLTLSQYLLGASILILPTTLAVMIAVSFFDSALVDTFLNPNGDRKEFALAIYVRLVRSIVLVPVYIATFFLVYHLWFTHSSSQQT